MASTYTTFGTSDETLVTAVNVKTLTPANWFAVTDPQTIKALVMPLGYPKASVLVQKVYSTTNAAYMITGRNYSPYMVCTVLRQGKTTVIRRDLLLTHRTYDDVALKEQTQSLRVSASVEYDQAVGVATSENPSLLHYTQAIEALLMVAFDFAKVATSGTPSQMELVRNSNRIFTP